MDVDIDDHTVARFVEVTSASPDHAMFFLQACGGNFDRAVQMYRGKQDKLPFIELSSRPHCFAAYVLIN